jgi:hypothetical protein
MADEDHACFIKGTKRECKCPPAPKKPVVAPELS